jgi:hypothetical protein
MARISPSQPSRVKIPEKGSLDVDSKFFPRFKWIQKEDWEKAEARDYHHRPPDSIILR